MRQCDGRCEQAHINSCPDMGARVAGLITVASFLGEVALLLRFAVHILGCARP